MEHLAARGISCPLPVKDRDGRTLDELAGRPAALITFLEGLWVRRPDIEHCAGVGDALAHLHLAGADFPMSGANALSIAGLAGAVRCDRRRADKVKPGLPGVIEAELRHLESDWPNGPAARRHPCRSLPRQRLLPRRQAVGPDRLLFRLQRHARL